MASCAAPGIPRCADDRPFFHFLASLTVRLAIDCYHDTHYTSGTYDHVRERRRLLRKVYRALYRFRAAANASALTRVRSRGYSMLHGIKVSEMTFAFRVSDQV